MLHHRGRENYSPAMHASFNELVTMAALSSINIVSHARTCIGLHTYIPTHSHGKRTHAVTPTCWNARVRAQKHIHTEVQNNGSWCSLPIIPLNTHDILSRVRFQCFVIRHCHLDTTQHCVNSLPLYDFIHSHHKPFMTQDSQAASFAQLSGTPQNKWIGI